MAKLLKLRRGTTSQHSSFAGAEGEVTVDTDKETLVVHDGSTNGGHPVAAEDLANVSSSAITGRLSSGSIASAKIATGAVIEAKLATDSVTSGKIVNLNVSRAKIANDAINGDKIADDSINSEHYVDGSIDEAHLANSAVTTGKLNNGAVTLAKIQDISQNYILGRSSSGSGQTQQLNASTVRSIINVENGATADQSKSDIDALNINADTVDSLHASSFIRSDADDTVTGQYNFHASDQYPVVIGNTSGMHDGRLLLRGSNNPYIRFREGNTDKAYIQWQAAGTLAFVNEESGEYLKIGSGSNGLTFTEGGSQRTVWHSGNDGSGSGLDADTVDGYQATQFVRSDASDTLGGSTYTFSSSNDQKIILQGSNNPYIRFKEGTSDKAYIQWNANGYLDLVNTETGERVKIASGSNGLVFHHGGNDRTVWHAGNDGSGSGLDADTVDGVQGSSFLRSDSEDTANSDINFNGGAGAITVNSGSDIRFDNTSTWTGEQNGKIQYYSGGWYFQANGTHHFRNGSGTNVLAVDSSGNTTAQGNVTAYSDARLKTDISTINDALGICGKLRGVNYKWLKDGSAGIGVIAQEVEEIIPEVVLTNVDTNPSTGETTEVKSVDYGKIVGVLINAINELKAEVDELKGGK